jgi:general secretion pathway protein A
MYESFYCLKERPFNLTPDPRFIYFTERHCEALANLVYGIRERKGFLVLSGEVGTGKTTLVNALLDTLERSRALSAFVFNPILTIREFFDYLLADFNIRCDTNSKSQCLLSLNSFLLERYRAGQVTVLVIDEAQNLTVEILEEIRLLTNLETSTEKLLQIVLVGQPELSLKLNSPELRQLKQRINLRCTLEPLSLFEASEYISTRLEIAGLARQTVFPKSAIEEIFRWSHGIPRVINVICDNALLTGYACDTKTIGPDIIREVARDLELTVRSREVTSRRVEEESDLQQRLLQQHGSAQFTAQDDIRRGAESFDLFVQFVDKLRERVR